MAPRDLFDSLDAMDALGTPAQVGGYRTILADPPWQERGSGKIKRGADRHYGLMPSHEIALIPVSRWAATNAHLYLWVTNNFLPDGLYVMACWGFRYVTKIDWFKGDISDLQPVEAMRDSDLQMGIGQYFRGVTESCLFGIRGHLPYQSHDGKRAQGRTGFHAPRGEHSAKPETLRRMAERVSPGPRLEMFARRPAPGWDLWGNQAPASAGAATQEQTHMAHEGAVEHDQHATTTERIVKVMQEALGEDIFTEAGATHVEDASFRDDLGCDSLDVIDLVMAVEEEFGIDVAEADVDQIKTVGQLIAYVDAAAAKLAAHAGTTTRSIA